MIYCSPPTEECLLPPSLEGGKHGVGKKKKKKALAFFKAGLKLEISFPGSYLILNRIPSPADPAFPFFVTGGFFPLGWRVNLDLHLCE